MKIKEYEFPLQEDGIRAIEYFYCKLLNEYRDRTISNIEKDWMDAANTWLITLESN